MGSTGSKMSLLIQDLYTLHRSQRSALHLFLFQGMVSATNLPTKADKKRVENSESFYYNADYSIENSEDPRLSAGIIIM